MEEVQSPKRRARTSSTARTLFAPDLDETDVSTEVSLVQKSANVLKQGHPQKSKLTRSYCRMKFEQFSLRMELPCRPHAFIQRDGLIGALQMP